MNYTTLVAELSNLAVTQYCNFGFNSFCKIGNTVIAANENGIYSLGGNTDAGSEIPAYFELQPSDWGISNLKRIRTVYIGYETKGALTLALKDDEDNERSYPLSRFKYDRQTGQQVHIGRDGQGRYWSVKISNVSGCSFSVDSIEVLPIILNRKPRRRA